MDNGKLRIDNIFNGKTYFAIPDYQRSYAWEEKQLNDFFKEVCFGLVSALLLGTVNCNAELAEGCLACVAEFGIGSKSACFDYDVGHSDYLSFLGFGFLFVCCDYIILCNIPIVKYNFRKLLNFGNAQHK